MRIHSDKITSADLYTARKFTAEQGEGMVWLQSMSHGSRTRSHAFEVKLEGDGTVNRRRQNPGAGHVDRTELPYAATWNQWGWFLARLFAIDPAMKCQAYDGQEDFTIKTDGKFVIPFESLHQH